MAGRGRHPAALPEAGSLRQAALLLVFAFGGFENASVPTEESQEPAAGPADRAGRTIAATAVLYVLIQMVALRARCPSWRPSPRPAGRGRARGAGPRGRAADHGWAPSSRPCGSISALALVGPRILYAFARHGQLPAALAAVHPRYRTPHVGRGRFRGARLAARALAGRFAQLAAVSAVARLLFSASTCLAVPVLRRRLRPDQRDFRLPGGTTIPLVVTAFSIWLLAGLTLPQALAALIGLLSGLVVYAAVELSRGASSSSAR